MKKSLILTLLLAFVTIGDVYANSYNARLDVKIMPQKSGYGLVYGSLDNKEPGEDAVWHEEDFSVNNPEAANDPTIFKFYLFAKPKDADCIFEGWYSDEECSQRLSKELKYTTSLTASENGVWATGIVYAKFSKVFHCETELLASNNGSYIATTADVVGEKHPGESFTTTSRINLVAVPNEGYKVKGWYTEAANGQKEYFSYTEEADILLKTTSAKIGVDFVKEGTPVFALKSRGKAFTDLNEANNDATEGDVIVLVSDGVLGQGDYSVKSGVTLLIPFDDIYTLYKDDVQGIHTHDYYTPYVFKTLTMDKGAHLNVNGTLCVNTFMHATGGGQPYPSGSPQGPYGMIEMKKGSEIVLNDGAEMYTWGYVIGEGTVIAKSGSMVYEAFQITSFRGGTASSDMAGNSQKIFLINQYYVQNIEVPLTIESGAKEMVCTCVEGQEIVYYSGKIAFIGEGGLFVPGKGTTLTKWYDRTCDRQMYVIDGDAKLDKISINVTGASLSSEDYVLPLTNNMSVTVENGTLSVPLSNGIALLPDMELNIKEGATLSLGDGNMYVYDKGEWDNYACYTPIVPLEYYPTMQYERTFEKMKDATLNIEGSLVSSGKGRIYTTAGGANICSMGGKGSITLTSSVDSNVETETYQVTQRGSKVTYVTIPITPAKLYNEKTNTYTSTASAKAGTTYYYVHGRWQTAPMPGGSLLGDVDGDGDIDVDDVETLAKKLAGMNPEPYNNLNADVDNNGRLSVRDVVKLVEKLR